MYYFVLYWNNVFNLVGILFCLLIQIDLKLCFSHLSCVHLCVFNCYNFHTLLIGYEKHEIKLWHTQYNSVKKYSNLVGGVDHNFGWLTLVW